MGCSCRKDPALVATALEYELSTKDIPIVKCSYCIREEAYERERLEQESEEHDARQAFFQLDDPERWQVVFNHIYQEGWRP